MRLHTILLTLTCTIATLNGARTNKITKIGISASWKDDSGTTQTTSQEWPYTVQDITYGIEDGSYTNGWRIATIDQPSVDVTLPPGWMSSTRILVSRPISIFRPLGWSCRLPTEER